MDALTLGEIAKWLALVAGIITSVTVIYRILYKIVSKAFTAALDKSLETIHSQQAELAKSLRAVRNELSQNNLQTARVDLNQAIEHAPHEHKAILDLAWHYFVELGGDTYMTGLFKEWATKENVDVSHILQHVRHGE